MRNIISVLLVVIAFAGCSKVEPDDADKFVGTWSLALTSDVRWGYDRGVISENGTIHIQKKSANEVWVTGYYNTTATASGNNLYLKQFTAQDQTGSLTYTFGAWTLSGSQMSVSISDSGYIGGYNFSCNAVGYAYKTGN